MNRQLNTVLESALPPAKAGALGMSWHPPSYPIISGSVATKAAARPIWPHEKLDVLANILTHGDESAKAKATAVVCALVQERVLMALFDRRSGALPRFEAHVNQVLKKAIADLEAGKP